MNAKTYRDQALLLLRVIPFLADETDFALKGGTAINLFVRDMPRLSVDIDLTYLPIEDRTTTLSKMSAALNRIAKRLTSALGAKVQLSKKGANTSKLFVAVGESNIVIEPNEVIRGSVFPVEQRSLCSRAQTEFKIAVDVQALSVADIFGGKICAALDRQHPRDLFDVKLLLENEGLREDIVTAFVVYLASHTRTMYELLKPTKKPLEAVFENEFQGMTAEPVTLAELVQSRDALIDGILMALTDKHRQFLLSLKTTEPNFAILGVPNVEKMPAVQWKLHNLRKLKSTQPTQHARFVDELKKILA